MGCADFEAYPRSKKSRKWHGRWWQTVLYFSTLLRARKGTWRRPTWMLPRRTKNPYDILSKGATSPGHYTTPKRAKLELFPWPSYCFVWLKPFFFIFHETILFFSLRREFFRRFKEDQWLTKHDLFQLGRVLKPFRFIPGKPPVLPNHGEIPLPLAPGQPFLLRPRQLLLPTLITAVRIFWAGCVLSLIEIPQVTHVQCPLKHTPADLFLQRRLLSHGSLVRRWVRVRGGTFSCHSSSSSHTGHLNDTVPRRAAGPPRKSPIPCWSPSAAAATLAAIRTPSPRNSVVEMMKKIFYFHRPKNARKKHSGGNKRRHFVLQCGGICGGICGGCSCGVKPSNVWCYLIANLLLPRENGFHAVASLGLGV